MLNHIGMTMVKSGQFMYVQNAVKNIRATIIMDLIKSNAGDRWSPALINLKK
jgi:hypothetical protein